jgi:hypothetical protein
MFFVMISSLATAYVQAQRIGQETSFDRQLRTRDDQAVREFVESKENIDIRDKAKNLDLSGDVRFEWRSIREKGISLYMHEDSADSVTSSEVIDNIKKHKNYRWLRGGHRVDINGIPLSSNDFDVEFNFKLKYSFENAWCAAHLQYDNPAGCRGRNACDGRFARFNCQGTKVIDSIDRDTRRSPKGSGEAGFINLKRAFMGYNVYADGKQRFDIEIGRRKLDDVFVSEVEFSNRFDGISFKYASAIDKVADWYCNAAVFVIDERVNHFGYVTEIGLLNVLDTHLDLRYSFIDWRKQGVNRCFIYDPYGARFQNSQISFAYTINPEIFSKKTSIEFYGGFLVNHAAKKHSIFTHNKRKNLAWYGGAYFGKVNKKGDWAADIEYVVVQAQAVSDFDVGSIGRGNVLDANITDVLGASAIDIDNSSYYGEAGSHVQPSGYFNAYLPRQGNANFRGWHFEFLYGITDNLSIDMQYDFSKAEDRHIGGRHYYSSLEIETIYAF